MQTSLQWSSLDEKKRIQVLPKKKEMCHGDEMRWHGMSVVELGVEARQTAFLYLSSFCALKDFISTNNV